MSEHVARSLLHTALDEYRRRAYADLVGGIGRPDVRTARGADGREYEIEIEAMWDDRPGGVLRVLGAIDDGSFRAFLPLSEEFLLSPEGRIVGEK
ncbi:MAG TPA: hypothetical protein VFK09_04495 [Gemmatimonadales bacterium]|jgi:hypothetical protein|nr:hypothetical protein [Gemmatimonadales bacterium]